MLMSKQHKTNSRSAIIINKQKKTAEKLNGFYRFNCLFFCCFVVSKITKKIIHINFKSKNNNKLMKFECLKILFFADNPYKQTIIISSSNKQQAIRVL